MKMAICVLIHKKGKIEGTGFPTWEDTELFLNKLGFTRATGIPAEDDDNPAIEVRRYKLGTVVAVAAEF